MPSHGNLRNILGVLRLQETGDGEALPVPKLDRSMHFAVNDPRNERAVDQNGMSGVEFGHGGIELQVYERRC